MKSKKSFILYVMVPALILLGIVAVWLVMTLFPKPLGELAPPEDLMYGKVLYVVDGDTIDFMPEEGEELRVRLIGIDAPESASHDESQNTKEGEESAAFLKNYLEGKRVGLELDELKEDKYGRTLAYVWLDGELVNKKILDEGFAEVLDIPPNEKYVDYLKKPSS